MVSSVNKIPEAYHDTEHFVTVVQAQLRALTLPEAAGQRFIVYNDLCSEQDYCDVSLFRQIRL
jgi:hypothetical protein